MELGEGDVWKLGRSAKCAVELKDETVSRNHAMIQRAESGEYYLIDLGSQNGSFVNDRRVSTPVVLADGDCISAGRSSLVFHNPIQRSRNGTSSVSDFSTRKIFAQRLVTVLVVDIRDYTGLTQTIESAVLCQVLGTWFSEAERIMQKHGSGVQKYIGDAVMAVWVHSAIERERTEIRQVLTALVEFVEATERLSQRFELPQKLHVGAGVNTGAAAVGSPGTGEFTALGDTVNTAFRLEESTKTLQTDLVLGHVTFDCLKDVAHAADYFREHEIELKGYSAPVQACAVSFADLACFLQTAPL